MRDEQEELRKRLDEVVGNEFDERGKRWGAEWLRHSVPRWVAGIVAGIAMVALVWWVLDSQLKAAHHAPPPPARPGVIHVIPLK